MALRALLCAVGTALALCAQVPQPVSVPFVGCKSDGQTGPLEAPKGTSVPVAVSRQAAQSLAYYKFADGPGVLGPRGWYCFGTYGSGGDTLWVSPRPVDTADGPAVEVSYTFGGTSGRFGVAEAIARVFPAYKWFVTKLMQGPDLPMELPSGPYPTDTLKYKKDSLVEYSTPAQMDGLGTSEGLKKNGDPIEGVAMIIGDDTDLLLLSVRLPSDRRGLAPAIVSQLEREAARRPGGF